jgi:hypothetical protein
LKLRGAVRINQPRDDLFRKVIEERRQHKDDQELYNWLKIFANSINGCFCRAQPSGLCMI